jgi:hypothetical protein
MWKSAGRAPSSSSSSSFSFSFSFPFSFSFFFFFFFFFFFRGSTGRGCQSLAEPPRWRTKSSYL